MRRHFVDIPPFSFWIHESGSGSPVVLIHGLGGSADWWRHNISTLAREFRVIAVDLIGFGRNRFFLQRSKLPLRFGEIAALLIHWIESSIREPVHLVGNSMGGQVAIHMAASRPDLVRSLTLVNSSGIPFEIAPGRHIANLVMPRGALSFATVLARDLFRAGPTAIAVAFTRLFRDDARPLLQRLSMPVLLLWGERDPLVPLVYAEQMHAMIPNSRLQVIAHAGHIPMWENPEAFNAALLEFLRSVDENKPRLSTRHFAWIPSGVTSGIVHREAGRARDVVLVHGLGMSSVYFDRFARALFDRGRSPIAPDLPGFGESDNAPPGGPVEHASILAAWADALEIRDAIWIGHSLGCNAVAHVANARPDLVREWNCIGPLWSQRSAPRLLTALVIDAFREQRSLFVYVVPAYWRCGLWRWFGTLRRYGHDLRSEPPSSERMIAGEKDPLPDRSWIRNLTFVPGAHACHFTFPDETASAVAKKRLDGVAGHEDEQRDHRGDDGHHPLTGAAGDSE